MSLSYNQATKMFERYLKAIKKRQGDYEQSDRVILEPFPADMIYEVQTYRECAGIYDLALSVYNGADPTLTIHQSRGLREKIKAILANRVEAGANIRLPAEQQPDNPKIQTAAQYTQQDRGVSATGIIKASR